MTHDWNHWCNQTGVEYTGARITYEEFMTTKLYGAETPMDLTSLVNLMTEHKDMYFMTDFKNCYEKDEVISGFQQIIQAAEDAGHMDILDRFIIQNHHNEFKHWVEEVYPFENWLYTVYSCPAEQRQSTNLISYCRQENIPIVTMPYSWYESYRDELLELTKPLNIRIFVHTVNDLNYANALMTSGVSGLYTDSILPDQATWQRQFLP